MAEVWFEPRYLVKKMRNPDLKVLREIVLHPVAPDQEFGDALISYKNGIEAATMIVLSDSKLGYYLKYIDAAREEWLSLGDEMRLSEVICPDDWEASAGLFVSPDDAWKAIHEFCETGQRSTAVRWIRPQEMPLDGNW